jgi:beta-glucanase (GH16 family)
LLSHAQPSGYSLVWADEFNGTTLDTTKWEYRFLGPRRKAVNVKEAVSLDGTGNLLITCTQADTSYHVGMIGTQPTFQATYGYFECRVKFQKEQGHWTAFWLQSPTINNLGNPAVNGTEIDIYEYLRRENNTIHHNLHWDGYGASHKSTGYTADIPGISSGYHTIAVEWTDTQYVFYIDQIETWRTTTAVSQRSEYIILSDEVDTWGGDITLATLPDTVFFDYVRVYQKDSSTRIKNIPFDDGIRVYPNPVTSKCNIRSASQQTKFVIGYVYSIEGVLMKTLNLEPCLAGRQAELLNSFDVIDLPPGLYILQIGEKATKFIKQ